jgi:hypothetical protein
MKRFLIFMLAGPLVGVLAASVLGIWGTREWYSPYWMLRVFVAAAYTVGIFLVVMASISWACELLLIHWDVKLPVRLLTVGGGVAVLTGGLGKFGLESIIAAGLCGTIAACCGWLSAHPFKANGAASAGHSGARD